MSNIEKKETRMMTGVVILMIASLVEKILGVIFKIPLYSVLGNVGMGYFNAAYSIFSTFYTISLTGFPIAVSIMISKSRSLGRVNEVNRIFFVALSVFITIGLIGSSLMFFGANTIADIIDKENNSSLCIKAIAPILLIICTSSSIKGFFQGNQNMIPTAVSEFLDAFGKCSLGVIFAIFAFNRCYSVEICAAYAIAGVTSGHLLGLIYLIVFKVISKRKNEFELVTGHSDSRKQILYRLFQIAVPITISSVSLGLTSNIDTFTIMNCLNSVDAMAKYGDYTTLAVTLFRLPQAFIMPISAVLTPALTASIASGNQLRTKGNINSSFKLASIISMPCVFGLGSLSFPIIYLLFGNENSASSISVTAPYLSILSVGVFFMAMLTVSSSILQAHKLEKKPVISAFLGALTKLVLNIVLVSSIGMIGAPISTVAGYFVMAAMNLWFILKHISNDIGLGKIILKPLISSAVMSVISVCIYFIFVNMTDSIRISVVISVASAVVIYIIALILFKGIDKEDILMFPKGDKIYRIIQKTKLM